jgi:hypothetical protein
MIFVLKSLIPYSNENFMLAFKPHLFFAELEKISYYKRRSLENALRLAERQKLIERQANVVRLTEAGKSVIRPFVAQQLPNGARLMVIFDIPEDKAVIRNRFRRSLQAWHFDQIQKSVWVTVYDHRQSVKELATELDISENVQLYECAPV